MWNNSAQLCTCHHDIKPRLHRKRRGGAPPYKVWRRSVLTWRRAWNASIRWLCKDAFQGPGAWNASIRWLCKEARRPAAFGVNAALVCCDRASRGRQQHAHEAKHCHYCDRDPHHPENTRAHPRRSTWRLSAVPGFSCGVADVVFVELGSHPVVFLSLFLLSTICCSRAVHAGTSAGEDIPPDRSWRQRPYAHLDVEFFFCFFCVLLSTVFFVCFFFHWGMFATIQVIQIKTMINK